MIATRTSFLFFFRKAATTILIPFALLDAAVFAISAYQQGVFVAWAEVRLLVVVELVLWLASAGVMMWQRATSDRFSAMQDEIEELKERISSLETRATG